MGLGFMPIRLPSRPAKSLPAPVYPFEPIGIADLDGDGKTDIIWKNTVGTVKVQIMDGTTVAATATLGTVESNTRLVVVGDFDGNGRDELVFGDILYVTGYLQMWFPAASGQSITAKTPISTPLTRTQTVSGAGDTGPDGKADIIIRDPSTNGSSPTDRVWTMNGATVTTDGALRAVPPEWQQQQINDFDNDGTTGDIFWRNTLTGDNYFYPLTGSTIGAGEGFVRSVPSQAWQTYGTGEFDNAGGRDVFWLRKNAAGALENDASGGHSYIYPLNGVNITSNEGYVLGTAAFSGCTVIGIGDFSGIGRKSEILWWNPATRVATITAVTFNNTGTGALNQYSIGAGTTVTAPT